jgi:hypothetical protein
MGVQAEQGGGREEWGTCNLNSWSAAILDQNPLADVIRPSHLVLNVRRSFRSYVRFRAYSPLGDSTYTRIHMDRHTRSKTCPDGDRGWNILRERSPAKRIQGHLVDSG